MIYFFTCVSLFFVSEIWAQEKAKTSKIESDAGGYSVEFPSKPKLEKDKNSEMYILGENDDKHGYVVSCVFAKNKLDLKNADFVKGAFGTAYSGMMRNLGRKATKITAKNWGEDGLPSRLYEFTLDDGGVYYGRVILTEDRVISCVVSGPKDWANGEKAQMFMNSIQVKPRVNK